MTRFAMGLLALLCVGVWAEQGAAPDAAANGEAAAAHDVDATQVESAGEAVPEGPEAVPEASIVRACTAQMFARSTDRRNSDDSSLGGT